MFDVPRLNVKYSYALDNPTSGFDVLVIILRRGVNVFAVTPKGGPMSLL